MGQSIICFGYMRNKLVSLAACGSVLVVKPVFQGLQELLLLINDRQIKGLCSPLSFFYSNGFKAVLKTFSAYSKLSICVQKQIVIKYTECQKKPYMVVCLFGFTFYTRLTTDNYKPEENYNVKSVMVLPWLLYKTKGLSTVLVSARRRWWGSCAPPHSPPTQI